MRMESPSKTIVSTAGLEPATYGLEVHRAAFAPRRSHHFHANFGYINIKDEVQVPAIRVQLAVLLF